MLMALCQDERRPPLADRLDHIVRNAPVPRGGHVWLFFEEWVEYRVMRRTHSSLMNARGVNPKLIADQQGHGVDVNLNVYTQSSVESRARALDTLESAFVN
jgi:hypothetical protein